MRRREFFGVLGDAVVALPQTACAQQAERAHRRTAMIFSVHDAL
jgi:hypothetical protein